MPTKQKNGVARQRSDTVARPSQEEQTENLGVRAGLPEAAASVSMQSEKLVGGAGKWALLMEEV